MRVEDAMVVVVVGWIEGSVAKWQRARKMTPMTKTISSCRTFCRRDWTSSVSQSRRIEGIEPFGVSLHFNNAQDAVCFLCDDVVLLLLLTFTREENDTMKLAVLSLVAGSAVAFTSQTASSSSRPSTFLADGMADLEAIAKKSNPVLGFYDPLQLSSITIYDNTNDQSIAFLRHSEIKHGRIAMAAFVGYILQSNGVHWPWPMTSDGTPFPSDAGSPPEQWDAIPDVAKVCFI